jgi:hypothetical protein
MAYNRNHAKRLLTAAEYELFASSVSPGIDGLEPKDLKRLVGRARRARDKYRDLQQRQSGAVRERKGARGAAADANSRTTAKATIFAETIQRFETRLAKLERAEARAAREEALARAAGDRNGGGTPPSNRASRRAAKAGAARGTDGFVSPAAKGAATRSKVGGPTAANINAHRRAATSRAQAKRDSR